MLHIALNAYIFVNYDQINPTFFGLCKLFLVQKSLHTLCICNETYTTTVQNFCGILCNRIVSAYSMCQQSLLQTLLADKTSLENSELA